MANMIYNNSKKLQGMFPLSIQPWVEWKHITMGKTHCPTCLKLDKCWFVKSNMPQLPQHEFCHCTSVPITDMQVKMNAEAVSPYDKFPNYLFNPNNPKNKGNADLFRLWGYGTADSKWMMEESERQAREKYIAGDYTLGKLDEFGQRIHI